MSKIIAEISGNHGGDLCRMLDMISMAKKAGCWAAKFQLYKPEDLPDFDPASNFPVPQTWLPHMFTVARSLQLELFASVFAPWAVTVLRNQGCRYFKVASPESTRLSEDTYRSIWNLTPQGTTFVSSGSADFDQMNGLFGGYPKFYCKAGYPATIEAYDIVFMAKNAVGFSDHTADIIAPLAMVGAGAQYIEKHFKLDDNCVDAAFSLNPHQMKMLCDLCL